MEKDKYTEFLKSLAKECYNQGDNFYADKMKRGYAFGYTNDYPLQHGKGESIIMPDSFVEFLYKKLNPQSLDITLSDAIKKLESIRKEIQKDELSLSELIDHFNEVTPK